MTHYTVMVIVSNDNPKKELGEHLIDRKLAPYSEELEVAPYDVEMPLKDVGYMWKHYIEGKETAEIRKNIPPINDDRSNFDEIKKAQKKADEELCKFAEGLTEKQLKELIQFMDNWNGCEGKVEKGKLYYISTYNENSKWDWYSLGGRWKGVLPLKKGTTGKSGRSGVFKNENVLPNGVDMAFSKDIDWDNMSKLLAEAWESPDYIFSTHAVLDKNGWHEPSKMGWFASTYDENEEEDAWKSKFKERWIDTLKPNDIVAIVDCHI